MTFAGVLAWLDDKSDWLSPLVVKEVRQVVRGREFSLSFGASLVAGLIVAFSKDAPIGLVPEDFPPAKILGVLGFVGVIAWLYRWMLKRTPMKR